MPGHGRLQQVCRELQFGYTKDIPVVFLTARTGLADMMEANRSGASAYITKPFRTQHLLQTMRDVLRDAWAYCDEITGLPTLAKSSSRCSARSPSTATLGILYVSVDSVQALEQSQGFEVVDEMYRAVGQAAARSTRSTSSAARTSSRSRASATASSSSSRRRAAEGFVGDDERSRS